LRGSAERFLSGSTASELTGEPRRRCLNDQEPSPAVRVSAAITAARRQPRLFAEGAGALAVAASADCLGSRRR